MVQMIEKYFQHSGIQKFKDENERAVQVIIIDAHLLIREALQRVVASFAQINVCASLNRTQDVLSLLKRGQGDVLLFGSSLLASDCLTCIKTVRENRSSVGIVVVQQRLNPETAFPIIRSGVQSLLGEDASEKDLAHAIMAAATGNTFLGQRAREILNSSFSQVPLHFTEREMQVMPLLLSGISNFRIAQQLGLKEKTIEKHLTHIYEKLHIQSRTEAILRLQTLHI